MTSMSCLRSSPCLKITPTGVAKLGDGMGQNSSHSGFFLEAITLHLSSWTRGIRGETICLCHCNSINFLLSMMSSCTNATFPASFGYFTVWVLFSKVCNGRGYMFPGTNLSSATFQTKWDDRFGSVSRLLWIMSDLHPHSPNEANPSWKNTWMSFSVSSMQTCSISFHSRVSVSVKQVVTWDPCERRTLMHLIRCKVA